MRTGKDPEDIHESMQINRAKHKYESGVKRHIGKNKVKRSSKS